MLQLNIDKKPQDTRIVVAMSGGVDSSTVAAALHAQEYQVVGITLQLYDAGSSSGRPGSCCAGKDIYDARHVAETFGFPHYVLNYEDRFKESVIDDFVDTYLHGETPIPCVRCNQTVKFKDLLAVAKDLDADALVTGHYVRRIEGPKGPELHKAVDDGKDQSYFLFATTKEQLSYTHFPLGGFTKEETRKLAESLGVPTADKPESQDICFVQNGSYRDVIKKLRPGAIESGEIVHIDGRVLGTHEGVLNFTVGQRRGLGISAADPLYVIKIEPENHRVIVGPESALMNQSFIIKNINWLADGEGIPSEGIEAKIRLRSLHDGVMATISGLEDGSAKVVMRTPEKAVTPGQACVMYDDSRVLGGGWITHHITA